MIYQIDQLSFSYDGINMIFEDVNISLPHDKITLLDGVNGSGKTTLCRLLSGLEKEYSGKIILIDNALSSLSTSQVANEVTYIKQEPSANVVATTPYEDMAIWQHKFKHKIDNDVISYCEKALKEFNMIPFKDQPFWELSGGQIKRSGLAALLLNYDKYWILDEPVTGLDEKLVDIFVNILQKRKEEGKGALLITHQQQKFKPLIDSFLKIENKKILIKKRSSK
jgi:ABC-type Mn2+/Zn2+ transport system ATPase subunit